MKHYKYEYCITYKSSGSSDSQTDDQTSNRHYSEDYADDEEGKVTTGQIIFTEGCKQNTRNHTNPSAKEGEKDGFQTARTTHAHHQETSDERLKKNKMSYTTIRKNITTTITNNLQISTPVHS